jgi:hypothetical protein
MSERIQPVKRISDTIIVTFDFSDQMIPGETIGNTGVFSELWSGVDATPSAMISGTATIDGQTITQKIIGGAYGAIYTLIALIDTSRGQALSSRTKIVILPYNWD